jgi:hypothetical protein
MSTKQNTPKLIWCGPIGPKGPNAEVYADGSVMMLDWGGNKYAPVEDEAERALRAAVLGICKDVAASIPSAEDLAGWYGEAENRAEAEGRARQKAVFDGEIRDKAMVSMAAEIKAVVMAAIGGDDKENA